MKKRFMIVLVVLFLIFAGVLPQIVNAGISTVSPRMQGLNADLAGLTPDEYTDLILFPASINAVDSDLIYTKFSNLNSVFGIPTDNSYLFGMKRKGMFILNSLSFNKTIFIPEWSRVITTDNSSSGREEISTYSGYQYSTTDAYNLILTKKFGDEGALSLRYDFNSNRTYNESLPNDFMTYMGAITVPNKITMTKPEIYESKDTATNKTIYKESVDGYEDAKYSSNDFNFIYSTMNKNAKNVSYLDFILNIGLLNNPEMTNAEYGIYNEADSTGTISDTSYKISVKDTRFKLGGGVMLRSDKTLSDVFGKSAVYSGAFHFTPMNKTLTAEITGSSSSDMNIKGSVMDASLSAGYVYHIKISDAVNLHTGVNEEFLYSKSSTETNVISGNTTTKYGDGSSSTMNFNTYLPAGMEIGLFSKLRLNLGATFILSFQMSSAQMSNTISQVDYTAKQNSYSSTTNWYSGLEYDISDNAVLSVTNFAKLTDLTNWGVGVELKMNEKVLDKVFKRRPRRKKKKRVRRVEPTAAATTPSVLAVKYPNMKLKTAPDLSSDTIKVMRKGEMYQVLDDEGKWLKVMSMEDGSQGWGMKIFFKPAE